MIAGNSSKGYTIQFIFFVVFCVSLMAVSIQFPQVNQSFQSTIFSIAKPLLSLVSQPTKWVTAVETSVSDHVSVYEENIKLKLELDDKQRITRDLSIIKNENEDLRSLLNMVKLAEGTSLTGRVISDKRSAFSHTMIIDTGIVEGVEKGQIVLEKNGLVGRVLEVYKNASRILLLTDHASRIPVKIIGTNSRGIVRGTNSYKLELVFTEDETVDIKVDMLVVTTGAGGIFAEGLPVGVIATVGKNIYIKPDVDFETLDLVSIQRKTVKGIL